MDYSTGSWAEDHELKLADVWRDESYVATGLPRKAPELPLVDPFDPDVVYFTLMESRCGDGHGFGVDLSTGKAKSCSSRSYKGLNDGYCTLQPGKCMQAGLIN